MIPDIPDIQNVLTGLAADSAKTRERVIKGLTAIQLQDGRVIEALQTIVSTDPVEYVREAARAQLVAAGQTPAESAVPVQLKEEGVAKPAAFAVGCMFIPIFICVLLAIVVIAILAIMGPQIGTIFSRVPNGLATP